MVLNPAASAPSSPRPAVAPLSTAPPANPVVPEDAVVLTGAPEQAPATAGPRPTTPAAVPATGAAVSATATAAPVPALLAMEEAAPAAEASRPALGSPAYWTGQARHMTDFFARVSVDREDGGFYTHLDADGNVTNRDEKVLMPTSRQVYAYSAAYRMTGDLKYLALAKHGVDFILQHHVRSTPDGGVEFLQRVDRKGQPLEGEAEKPLVINEQSYGLTGLVGYYRATKDPAILDVIRRGHETLTRNFADPVHGGFFDNPGTTGTKSYNSTVYPATSALLEIAEGTNGDLQRTALEQVKSLANLFVQHFPDPATGFIVENFTADWKPDWRGWQRQDLAGQNDGEGRPISVASGTIGVAGHNTQGALFLPRADRLLREHGMQSDEDSARWTATARTLVDSMLDRAYDARNGGWHDVFVRETGQKMWHTNKAFWQQEEGYLATLALARLTGEPRYREATDRTLEFWDRAFVDRRTENGQTVSYGDRQTVTADGAPLPDPKGGPGKSSYHSTEMALLASEIGQWRA